MNSIFLDPSSARLSHKWVVYRSLSQSALDINIFVPSMLVAKSIMAFGEINSVVISQ